ncbi:hypothetical protein ACQ4PT_024715 [Festuca glaucescens]
MAPPPRPRLTPPTAAPAPPSQAPPNAAPAAPRIDPRAHAELDRSTGARTTAPPRLTLPTAASSPPSAAAATAQTPPNATPETPRASPPFPAPGRPTLTTSSCTAEVAEGGHVFHVHQYSLLKFRGVGMPVRSGAFDVGGHSWAILFYPAGSHDSADGQHHVSVYLELLTPDAVVPAWFDLRLMDQSSGQWHSLLGRLHAVFDTTFPTLHHEPRCWGEPSCSGSNLETPEYVRNGSLAIRCDVGVVTPRLWEAQPVTPMITQAPPPPPGLPQDLGRLLDEKGGCDVTVRVRGEAFPAHRAILAARSPLLRKKLLDAAATDKAKTKTKTRPPPSVEITLDNDMEPAVFKAVLHFIYTDELEVPPVADDGGEGTAEFLRRMFLAADGCGVEALKWHCESLLCGILSKRTLSATMAFAERHRCDRLRAACAAAVGNFSAGPKRGRDDGMGDSEAYKRLRKN